MKKYIVKTLSGRRLLVSATDKKEAKKQIEDGCKTISPWNGVTLCEAEGERVAEVSNLGTMI